MAFGIPHWQAWGSFDDPNAHQVDATFVCIFDTPIPPYDLEHRRPISLLDAIRILVDIGYPAEDIAGLITVLKYELRALMGESFVSRDAKNIILMPAWEVKHRPVVAAAVRLLAMECPTLEKLNWYISWPYFHEDGGPLWAWTITRVEGGPPEVTGKLYWEKCPAGKPPALRIAVGREREGHTYA